MPPSSDFDATNADPVVNDNKGDDIPELSASENRDELAGAKTFANAQDSSQSNSSNRSATDDASDKPSHTSLICLSLVARHHGIDVSPERLIHDYSLEHEEASLRRFLRIAKDTGLKARHTHFTWKQLEKLGEAFPVIARLTNGNYVIIVGTRNHQDDNGKAITQAAVFDPLADKQGFIYLDRKNFEKAWKGEVILSKRTFSLLDTKQPFSLKWFIPEMFKQRTAFIDVAIAALFIHLIALVVPLYFQIVIDKVLVNYAIQTLHVLTAGIAIALIFDAILGYLRSYLLLHATSKIDIRVATRTFGHLLKLPMSFFEHSTAGVLTKHMQQTNQIREFLTGNLFLTLLDSTALFIFLPMLLFYSVPLTVVVLGFSVALAINIAVLLGPYRRRLEALYNAEGERQSMLVDSCRQNLHRGDNDFETAGETANGRGCFLRSVVGAGKKHDRRRTGRVPNDFRSCHRSASSVSLVGAFLSAMCAVGADAGYCHEPRG